MGAVTYPDSRVVKELTDNFVPCRLESAKAGDLPKRMNVRWLPGLVVAEADERAAHVQVGFLPPEDFLLELEFGRGIVAMGGKRYDEAHALLRHVANAPSAERAPEALFWLGISRYRQSKAFGDCQEAWAEIVRRWPDSQWSRKVSYALATPG